MRHSYNCEALIEIPVGSQNKYEVDKENGRIKLDRVLFVPMNYPVEYGFIENTLAYDNDPLDILVITTNPTFPGCIIDVRVIGYLDVIDTGERDEKIISVPTKDPRFSHIYTYHQLPPHTMLEIEYFFKNYKNLTGKEVEINGWKDSEEAVNLIEECRRRYKEDTENN